MIQVNKDTKKAQEMIWEWRNRIAGKTIEEAYTNPSADKISSFNDIWFRAKSTTGYNQDLKVTVKNCYSYSTMYTFTNNEGTFLVKDTKSYTYITQIA